MNSFTHPVYSSFALCLCFLLISLAMGHFNISTLNLNGARDVTKRSLLYELMKVKRTEVMFVQETHSDCINECNWKREWEGEVVLSHKSSSSGGVGILFSKSFTPASFEVEQVIEGRLLVVRAVFELYKLVFINVYAPTTGPQRVLFLHTLSTRLSQIDTEDFLFLGGDLNCTEFDSYDRNHLEPHKASQSALRKLIETHDLDDVWRSFNGDKRQYTWAHSRGNLISLARLDRFYCFKHHFNIFKKCRILPVGFTDHALVDCSVLISNLKPKSAYWHFNTALLHDEHFKDVFRFFWGVFKNRKKDYNSLRQWWDCGKVEIMQLCQEYTLNVTRDITRSIEDLGIEIVELQSLVDSTGNRGHIENLKTKNSALRDLLGTKAQGALVRSRFQSATLMDAPSKFFFGLEKRNGQSRLIHALRSDTGQELRDAKDIRKRAVDFYSELFTSEYKDNDELFDQFCDNLPKVPDDVNAELGEPLRSKELLTALQSMEGGKAPGIDGLPVEFFREFWSELGEDLLHVFNESFKDMLLPMSCRRAVITLLPKKGDLQEIKNWRPVSLLCTDYKILSKALANRLREVMELIIHQDQTYCVPGRSILDNVSLIRDILDISSSLGINVGLIGLDQQKAFDRTEHLYLWRTLQRFGLSPGLIAMIRVLYQDIESVLKINGGLSAPFKVHRGVRQGCSLSGMLYSLSIEPLLCKIRNKIEGLVLKDCSKKYILSAYADDLIILVKNKEEIEKLKETVKDFGTLSSAKVNWDKSEALAVGRWREGLPNLPGGMKWKKDGIKYLGVYVGNDTFIQKNWEGILEKVEGRLNKWKWLKPQMSFKGRVLIINNLVASALWHRLACMEPPSGLIKKVQSILVDFFWDKLHWVPQSVLFLPKEEGGQGLIHIESRIAAFRVQFAQRYLIGPNDLVWREAASIILRQTAGLGLDSSLFLMNCTGLNLCGLPPFYQAVIKAWNCFKWRAIEPTCSLYWLLEEPLINKARFDIQDNSTPGLNKMLCTSGAVKLKNIVDIAGPDLSNTQGLASFLGLKSLRQTRNMLNLWFKRLTEEEVLMLKDYSEGVECPDKGDPFPDLGYELDLEGVSGPLLNTNDCEMVDLYSAKGKMIYKSCVKALNKNKLNGRIDTVWRHKMEADSEVKPVWRVLYKPPIRKRTGDLQWRILHGAIAVNGFISMINPTVSSKCPFCEHKETIFHCFYDCKRLCDLFNKMENVFIWFGEKWSKKAFIMGAGYRKNDCMKWQLLNFVVGEAKMAIYTSRKNKVEGKTGQDALPIFISMVKARIWIDFHFFKGMNNIDEFIEKWCFNDALCSVMEENLIFNIFLM